MHSRSDGLTDDLWGRDREAQSVGVHKMLDVPFSDLALCLLELRPVSFTFSMHGVGEWSCV